MRDCKAEYIVFFFLLATPLQLTASTTAEQVVGYSVLSVLPDDCGYTGTMEYASSITPTFQWKLQNCVDSILNDSTIASCLSLDIEMQLITVDLSNCAISLQDWCKRFQNYFVIFADGWFLPDNTNLKTNFRLIFDSGLEHNFSLEVQNADQNNPVSSIESNQQLRYSRNGVYVGYVDQNDGNGPGFLDQLASYGAPDPQNVDIITLVPRQRNLADSIRTMLSSNGTTAASVINALPGVAGDLKTAVFDFIIATSIVAAVPTQVEARGATIKTANTLFDQWVAGNKVILNDQSSPTIGRTPGADDYMLFLLNQYLDGNIDDCFTLKDLFYGADETQGKYWPTSITQTTPDKIPEVFSSRKGRRLRDNTLGKSLNLYQQPLVPMPVMDSALQHLANLNYDAVSTTKIRSAFESDLQFMQNKFSEAIGDTICPSDGESIGSCIANDLQPSFDSASFSIDGYMATFRVSDPGNPTISVPVSVPLNKVTSASLAEEFQKAQNNKAVQLGPVAADLGKACSGLQTWQQFLSSIQDFQKGDTVRGIWTLSQSTKSAFDLLGLQNSAVSAALKSTFNSALQDIETDYDETALNKLLPISEIQGIAGDVQTFFSKLAPLASFVSDIKSIGSDIAMLRDPNASKIEKIEDSIDIGIDVSITALDVAKTILPEFAPELGIAELALGLVKEDLSYFFNDISYELSKAGKSFGSKMLAVGLGIAEAVADIFTGGYFSQKRALDAQVDQTNQILGDFDDLSNYFSAPNEDCTGAQQPINFTAGSMSQYGGDLYFTMSDDDTYTVELRDVPLPGERQGTLSQTFRLCPNCTSVVLGMGESSRIVYKTVTATLKFFFWVLDEKRARVFDHLEDDATSIFGSYTGNSQGNSFIAYGSVYKSGKEKSRRLRDDDNAPNLLVNYNYSISGLGGNDSFFLGPQQSTIQGNEGSDFYYITPTGGACNINNFSPDNLPDVLKLYISVDSLSCYKFEDHLIIQYSNTHHVEIVDWFVHTQQDQHRHLIIYAFDEVGNGTIDVQVGVFDQGFIGQSETYLVSCNAITIDRSKLDVRFGKQTIDVREDPWTKVTTIVGTKLNDTIIANDLGNYIDGGPLQDELHGGNGSDTYNVRKDEGCDRIYNYDPAKTVDTVLLSANYSTIRPIHMKNTSDLRVADALTCVIIDSWFLGDYYQHIQFKSEDHRVFTVQGDPPKLKLYALDFSEDPGPVNADLTETDDLRHITTIKDSPFDDTIKGNYISNTLTCHGADKLSGGAGSETYVITSSCVNGVIDNSDDANNTDIILLMGNYTDIFIDASSDGLGLQICNITNGTVLVTLLGWFANGSNQHAIIVTADGLQSSLPNSVAQLKSWGKKPVPFEVSLTNVNCTGFEIPLISYDLNTSPYQNVTRFVAQGGECSYQIVGNSFSNYFDPGTGDPFGFQFLQGGPGSDTYVIGHLYGHFNQIDNFATDGKTDILQFGVMLKYIDVTIIGNLHILLSSTSGNDTVAVQLNNYLRNTSYQHLLVQTADGVTLQIVADYPYIKCLILDYSNSPYSQLLNLTVANFTSVKIVYGSTVQQNIVYANSVIQRIVGGNKNDVVYGGTSNELIEGLDGNDRLFGNDGMDTIYGGNGADTIHGGAGDDVIYGGAGADKIDGGDGNDAIVFSGLANKTEGVVVSLTQGIGRMADAEGDTYVDVESVHGSEYDDIIEGDNNDNTLNGYGGDDIIILYGGVDMVYGGTGSDTYNMTAASGWKSITNFASDEAIDTILADLRGATVCQYSVGKDLYIHVGSVGENSLGAYMIDSRDVLNLVVWDYLNGSEYQHLKLLDPVTNTSIELGSSANLSSDAWVDLFKGNDRLQLQAATNQSLSLLLESDLWSIPRGDFRIDLTYVCDGSSLYTLTDVIQQNPAVTLSDLSSGVMCTVSLVLIRCNQIVIKGGSHHYRTLPNPPRIVHTSHISSVSLAAEWQSEGDYNSPLYEHQCFATAANSAYNSLSELTSENITDCFIPRLHYRTNYEVTMDSIAGGVVSELSVGLLTTTLAICINLAVSPHTEILDEHITGTKSYATLACDRGYFLAASQYPDGRTPITTWPGFPDVECDTSQPCTDSTCNYKAFCLPLPCSTATFGISHLEIVGGNQPSYGYGDQATVMCMDGWAIGGQLGATLEVHCTCVGNCSTGEWDTLPTCIPVHNCTEPTLSNGAITGPFNSRGDLPHGDDLHYACNPGYDLSGPTTAHCNNGTLVPSQIPTCTVQYCTPCLRIPDNADVSTTGGKTIDCPDDPGNGYEAIIGTTVTFSCWDGYWLDGPGEQTCVLNGDQLAWSLAPQQASCNPYPCTENDYCNYGFDCDDTSKTTYQCVCNPPDGSYCCNDEVCDSTDDPTCCPNDGTGQRCCPIQNAHCCNDGTCCPSGVSCGNDGCTGLDGLSIEHSAKLMKKHSKMTANHYANSSLLLHK